MRFFLLLFGFCLVNCHALKTKSFNEKGLIRPKNVKISGKHPKSRFGPCEPSIAINLSNPKNIVAGSVLNLYHYSFDGGKTWQTNELKSKHGVFGDPVIVADNKDNFYYFHLVDPDGRNYESNRWLEQIGVQKSEDGGKTWFQDVTLGGDTLKDHDKQWAVYDPIKNKIHVTWTLFDKYGGGYDYNYRSVIMYSSSEDEGKTWSLPKRISTLSGDCFDKDETIEGAVPAIGINGEIYVSWALNKNIYFTKSIDGGETWEQEKPIIYQKGGWDFQIPFLNRANGMPVTLYDLSETKTKGNIYINWTDQTLEEENKTNVFIKKSTDGGKNFSENIQVNQDKDSINHCFFSTSTIDSTTGFLYVLYYQMNKKNKEVDVVLALSSDGAESFKYYKISDKPFKVGGVFFGDYIDISAHNGTIRPIWTEYETSPENKGYSIWTAIIDNVK